MAMLTGGCILEDNPAFVESASSSGSATDTSATTAPSGPSTADGPTEGPTDTNPTADSTGTTGDNPVPIGCDDPKTCTTYHIGPNEDTCPHEADGRETSTCDFIGTDALHMAVTALTEGGEGGLVIMHPDQGGATASFAGSLDIPATTTIRAAEGVPPQAVRVYSRDTPGTVRLRGNGIHLQGFTVVCREGGGWGIITLEDRDTKGSQTSHHLLETLSIVATRPENAGVNTTWSPIQSLGPHTTVRNTHISGYFEEGIDMRLASGSVLSHNTVLYYEAPSLEVTNGAMIDARLVDRLEISNNVFIALTSPFSALVAADQSTTELVIAGNAFEGVAAIVSGIDPDSAEVSLEGNTDGPLELESPMQPLVLADSTLAASTVGANGGISIDGVSVDTADPRRPGAYQLPSTLSTPRRREITVGEGMCGGTSCTIDKSVDNELQRAVWSAWPGSTVEIYPSATPYAGPVVISWPITLAGTSNDPQAAVIRRVIEDDQLAAEGLWEGKNTVVDLLRRMSQPTVIERLTIEAGPDQIGIYHEGQYHENLLLAGPSRVTVANRHQIRRVVLRDAGTMAGALANMALYIGSDVVVHDVLINGGYDTCVRFGPRTSEGNATPVSTAYVHHLTCRLTLAGGNEPLAAFEVASVQEAIIADAVIELAEPGPLFRAQRRTSGDQGATAADLPLSFTASAIAARGFDTNFDGFAMANGTYTLTDVDTVGMMEPLFVSDSDSHLAPGALGIDSGVDPATLEPELALSEDLDGVDRTGLPIDRGCYEQGM
ncbi:MAG: hypothetical protein AAGF11_20385 [Myxococcota bacterium]